MSKRQAAGWLTVVDLERTKILQPNKSTLTGILRSGLEKKRDSSEDPDLPQRQWVDCRYRRKGTGGLIPITEVGCTSVQLEKSPGSTRRYGYYEMASFCEDLAAQTVMTMLTVLTRLLMLRFDSASRGYGF